MRKLRAEMHRRMLGNGYCARPVELDCHFESICETCTFFVTTIEFKPTLRRQRDDAKAKGQIAREHIFDGLLQPAERHRGKLNQPPLDRDHPHKSALFAQAELDLPGALRARRADRPEHYYAHRAAPVSQAVWDDARMANVALCVWRANRSLYGADKLATALRKTGHDIGRDRTARLMRIVGIKGARRGKHTTTTTRRDPAATRYPDLIRRKWRTPTRPDQWWVADFTYLWTLESFVYTSFVSDVCSRRILGWRVSSSKATSLVMAALEQAAVHPPAGRRPLHRTGPRVP